jgi:L-lactate dehydrogenase complex protein LldG
LQRPADTRDVRTARFAEEVRTVGGECAVATSAGEVASAIASIVERAGARRVAVSNAPLARAAVATLPPRVEVLDAPDRDALFGCDVGVTTAQWGVAATGSLVLVAGDERHRLASLVPPVHVAIVDADAILETLGDALACVAGDGKVPKLVTFVTGPSRTADIELTLAIGVHGPRALHVVVLDRRQIHDSQDGERP